MNSRKICIGIFIFLFGIGLAFAIQPVGNWTIISTGHFTPNATTNVTTAGGNVTNMNLSSSISTTKWAGYWGNVSGSLVLAPNSSSANFYAWAWNISNGGVVCAVAAPYGFNWAAVQNTTAPFVDTVWAFGAASDNATNTLVNTCTITVGGVTVTGTAGNMTGGNTFKTCALSDAATPTTKSDLAFCVNIASAGTLFTGGSGNYQLMVPTNKTYGATETYSFWMDLG